MNWARVLSLLILLLNIMSTFAARKGEPDIAGMINTALSFHRNGEAEQALAAYDELVPVMVDKVDANFAATVHSNRGALLMQAGSYESAKGAFEAAVAAQPENINARFNLAVTLTSKLGEHLKAIRHCAAVLKQDGGHVKALHLMGNIMQSLDRPADAEKYFSKAAQAQRQGQEEIVGAAAGAKVSVSARGKALEWGRWGGGAGRLATAAVGSSFTHTHNEQTFTMTCLSESPRVFRIESLLSEVECAAIKSRAEPQLEYSYVTGGTAVDRDDADGYRTSINAWLSPDELLLDVQKRLTGLMGLEPSAAVALQQAAEELQVIRYEAGGQFKPHHDSSNFLPRVFTLLVYLNNFEGGGHGPSGGGTWFPFSATGGNDGAVEVEEEAEGGLTVEQANSAALMFFESCKGGEGEGEGEGKREERRGSVGAEEQLSRGLVTAPTAGSAILFFNHLPTGAVDTRAVHAGLPVAVPPGEEREGVQKWAANYWFGGLRR